MNDLTPYASFLAEERGESPTRERVTKGLMVCKLSNSMVKGTIVKKEGNRAQVDFREGDSMRSVSALLIYQ